jgi:hypothetical protein
MKFRDRKKITGGYLLKHFIDVGLAFFEVSKMKRKWVNSKFYRLSQRWNSQLRN